MLVRILGSAAGGGFPQWNCNCPNCDGLRSGRLKGQPRTQSSIAVRSSAGSWFLVNASPDVRQQLEALRDGPALGVRSNPFAGVLLTDAEIDHTTGLLLLRESSAPLHVYSTAVVHRALTRDHPILRTLESYCGVAWRPLEPGRRVRLGDDAEAALDVEPFPVVADPPKYVAGRGADEEGWAVGLTFRDPMTDGVVTYAPAVGELDDDLLRRFEASDVVLLDGTFWRDDELVHLGIGSRTAREMSHVPIAGPGGSLERLRALRRPRKLLVHINNTNPILIEDSEERLALEAAGIEVAEDGLTIEV